jgi:hypothetical protein
MLKFTLASRHKDEGTRERYFYEWSIIHVALMLTSPSVMKIFKRYAQQFNVPDVANEMLVHPLSAEGWESFADHWIESYEDVFRSVRNKDYIERMQPHSFGSHKFITSLSEFETVYERDGFRSGGVKLIHFLKRKPGLTQEEFHKVLRHQHSQVLRQLFQSSGCVRKYVQNTPVPLDSAIFKGTLFEYGSIGLYGGIEEFWFDTLDAVARLRCDPGIYESLRASERSFVDDEGSISMVVNERVVWDFVTPGELSPPPAILNPNSLEAAIDRQGYTGFDQPSTVAKAAKTKNK